MENWYDVADWLFYRGSGDKTGEHIVVKPTDDAINLTFSGGGGAYHYQSPARVLSPATADVPVLAYDAEGNVLGLWGGGTIVSIGKHTRDLTNAVWVNASGLATVAKDQVGADGVANSASRFQAGTANDTLLQTVTRASNPHTAGFNIKRLVGTGTVEITVNGGTNWVDITSLINTSAYVRVKDTRTVTNPVYGIRIVTSGDSVAVDFANLVQSSIDLPPVQVGATTVTALANIITGALPAAITGATAYGLVWQGFVPAVESASSAIMDLRFGTDTANRISIAKNTSGGFAVSVTNGGVTIYSDSVSVGAIIPNAFNAIAARIENGNYAFYVNGTPENTPTGTLGAPPTGLVTMGLMTNINPVGFQPNYYTKVAAILTRPPTNAELIAWSTI